MHNIVYNKCKMLYNILSIRSYTGIADTVHTVLQSCMRNYHYHWLSILAILLFMKLVPYCGVRHWRDRKILYNIPESDSSWDCVFSANAD